MLWRWQQNLITAGTAKKVAVAGGEVMSKVVNWQDRATCVLFGDGAGVAIVIAGDGHSGILSSNWGCDGNLAPLLYQPAGGTRLPTSEATLKKMAHTVHMEGNQVFKHAVRAMGGAATTHLSRPEMPVLQSVVRAVLRPVRAETCLRRTGRRTGAASQFRA